MECKITLTASTDKYTFKYNIDNLDGAIYSVDELINKITNPNDLRNIVQLLINENKSSQGVNRLSKPVSNIANATSKELFEQNGITYSGKQNVQVLYVQGSNTFLPDVSLQSTTSTKIKEGDHYIYVVRNHQDMVNLAKYLQVIDFLEDNPNNKDIKSGKNKILAYLQGVEFSAEDIVQITTDIRNILNRPLKTNFNDVYANAIIRSINYSDEKKLIKKSTISRIFLDKIGTTELNGRLAEIKGKLDNKGKLVDSDYQTMLDYIFKYITDKIKITKTNGIFLQITREYPSIGDIYGTSIKQILTTKAAFNITYRGEVIATITDEKGNTKYIPSRFFHGINTRMRAYDNLKEAQEAIDNSINSEYLFPDSLIRIILGKQSKRAKLDYYMNNLIIVPNSIENFKDYVSTSIGRDLEIETYKDFNTFVEGTFKENSGKIKEVCNSTFKASLFMYGYKRGIDIDKLLNNLNDDTKNSIDNVYYIHSVNDSVTATKTSINLNQSSSKQIKKNNELSNITMLNIITQSLSKQFNTQFELYSDTAYDQNGNEIEGSSTANAFIYNGTIYINLNKANVSDAIHECMHLLVPYLRGTAEYENFLNSFISNRSIQEELEKMGKKGVYQSLPYNDKVEELFVKYLSLYITDELPDGDIKNLFNNLAKIEVPDNTPSNISAVGNTQISNMGQFFPLINQAMEQFLNRTQDDEIVRRKAVNALRQAIKSNEVKEECE